ncbi:MAG: DUF6498-containing protein [Lysobacterales bacterium]
MDVNAPMAGDSPAFAKSRVLALALLVNAVPVIGILHYGWSAANVLVLYWFENLLIAIATTIRLVVHRNLTRKRGYWRVATLEGVTLNDQPVKAGIIGGYAMKAFGFTLAHGVFVVVLLVILAQNYGDQPIWQVAPRQVLHGAIVVAAMVAVGLVADLATIRWWSFAAMKAFATGQFGRIAVLHLAIIFGMFAMAATGSPFSVVFVLIGLKTLTEVGTALATARAPDSGPRPPPAWMLKAANRFAKDKGGAAGLERKLAADADAARRQAAEDEEAMPAGG